MLLQLLQYLWNGLHVLLTFIFGVDDNIIEVHYHKNVKILCQDLVDIVLKCSRYIGQSKKHHLVLEMAIAALEDRFLFIAFSDLHLMVGIGIIKLDEMLSSN